MRVSIEGYDLPGRTFCDATGEPYDDVHVGVQIRKDPEQLIAADAEAARWEVDITVVAGPDESLDFKGPAVHGRRGDRFIYLTWGSIDAAGDFGVFRRAKLMLNRIDPELVRAADNGTHQLAARVRLSDDHGTPRCARVDPPDITWSAGSIGSDSSSGILGGGGPSGES
jgi:hypothetical protein